MPRQLGHLSEGGVFPDQDLVLRVAVGAHLEGEREREERERDVVLPTLRQLSSEGGTQDSPTHWRASTRPGCTPGSRCRCTAGAALSACSRSGCSGRRCRRRRRGGRAGVETRRWLSLQPGAPCIAARGSGWNGSTPGAGGEERRCEHSRTAVARPQRPQSTRAALGLMRAAGKCDGFPQPCPSTASPALSALTPVSLGH